MKERNKKNSPSPKPLYPRRLGAVARGRGVGLAPEAVARQGPDGERGHQHEREICFLSLSLFDRRRKTISERKKNDGGFFASSSFFCFVFRSFSVSLSSSQFREKKVAHAPRFRFGKARTSHSVLSYYFHDGEFCPLCVIFLVSWANREGERKRKERARENLPVDVFFPTTPPMLPLFLNSSLLLLLVFKALFLPPFVPLITRKHSERSHLCDYARRFVKNGSRT